MFIHVMSGCPLPDHHPEKSLKIYSEIIDVEFTAGDPSMLEITRIDGSTAVFGLMGNAYVFNEFGDEIAMFGHGALPLFDVEKLSEDRGQHFA